MPELPFYAEGLRFSCTRCSSCCRHESGFVFLSEADVYGMAARLGVDYQGFLETYCRWVPWEGGADRLSLKEKSNYDCIFWRQGCLVYEERPIQCKTFPFWRSNVLSAEAWEAASRWCPGMGKGELHTGAFIESCLESGKKGAILIREAGS
jgi:Fe-S-cluster containining protein